MRPKRKGWVVMAKLKPYRNPELCPDRSNHQAGPINYAEWVEWANRMAETQEQAMCPGCDLWVIWIPLEDDPNPEVSATPPNP